MPTQLSHGSQWWPPGLLTSTLTLLLGSHSSTLGLLVISITKGLVILASRSLLPIRKYFLSTDTIKIRTLLLFYSQISHKALDCVHLRWYASKTGTPDYSWFSPLRLWKLLAYAYYQPHSTKTSPSTLLFMDLRLMTKFVLVLLWLYLCQLPNLSSKMWQRDVHALPFIMWEPNYCS